MWQVLQNGHVKFAFSDRGRAGHGNELPLTAKKKFGFRVILAGVRLNIDKCYSERISKIKDLNPNYF